MVNLLFVSLSGRVIKDTEGNLYLDSHMNYNIISRYKNICGQLTLLLRDNCQVVSKYEAKKIFNVEPNNVDIIPCTNQYKPIYNIINPTCIQKSFIPMIVKLRKSVEGKFRITTCVS